MTAARAPSGQPYAALVAYVSGHGYGHFTRSAAVLERVAAAGVPVHVRTAAQALRLARAATWPASVTEVDVGPGVAQRGPLAVDLPATRAALQQHLDRWAPTVAAEAAWLRATGAALVFGDVPPIAFAAAAEAGVPSVALANFSWSWIYEGYARHDPWFAGAAGLLRRSEERATLCLALEMGGGLEVFPRAEAIPPVARVPTLAPAEVRARVGFGDDGDRRPLVLVTFGGFGGELELGEVAGKNPALRLLVVSAPVVERANLRAVEPGDALPHHELVAACDCVLGKPGYGTVAECLSRPTAFAHVARGEFREYPPMVAAIERWLPSARVPPEEFAAGRWTPHVERALAAGPREPAPRADGVRLAAERILSLLRRNN